MFADCLLHRPLKKQHVQCRVCEHWCAIAPGEAGRCGVRRNYDGQLKLVVYGKAAAINVDPVEKKPLFHFLPGGNILSLGTLGCNLRCQFCQNAGISQVRDFDPQSDWIGRDWSPAALVDACGATGSRMIAFTYNEPVIFLEYALDTMKLARQARLKTVFVSSGFETIEAIELLAPWMDAINIDLKGFTEKFYRDICGARLAPVMRNIEHIRKHTGVWVEVTTLLIPGLNDSPEEVREMARFLRGVDPDMPWHLSAFHPDHNMLNRPRTPRETILRSRDIGREEGLRYVYAGNISPEINETRCPRCQTALLSRSGYITRTFWETPGQCHGCGESIAGVWNNGWDSGN
ncbi:MAG: hypothetical protein GMKNLPBB_01616 [Myxococcota bacterium]|nr:hypothetical protein [Myxococcota bacterium]